MKIVWDEIKRQANLDKHRLDFVQLNKDFFLGAIIRPVNWADIAQWEDWTTERSPSSF